MKNLGIVVLVAVPWSLVFSGAVIWAAKFGVAKKRTDQIQTRVNLTLAMLEKLISRESLYFKIKPGCSMLEVRIFEDRSIFSQLDRGLRAASNKLEKFFE